MIQGALAEPTLFERLGGYAAVAATADDLAERLYVDAALDARPAINAFHDEHEKAGRKYVPTPGPWRAPAARQQPIPDTA